MKLTKLIFALLLFLYPLISHAYVGPGLGLGAIGVVLGIIGSILLALIAIFWYPIKRLLKGQKQSGEANNGRKLNKLNENNTPAKPDVPK